MKRLTILFSGLALMAFAACGGDSSTDSFDSWISTQEDVIETICACDAEPATCETENGFDATEVSCIRGVVSSNDSPALQMALDCQTTANSNFHTCIEPIACDDMTSARQDCGTAYQAAIEACPDIPEAVDAAVETMCFPE
jgi:hypothetical protein